MFAYWGLKFVQRLVCLLPAEGARFLGRGLGRLVFRLDRRHRKIALENLRRAFPDRWNRAQSVAIVQNSFGQLGFNLAEFLRLPVLTRTDWKGNFTVSGAELVKKALKRKKGIIFVLAHFGNWEYLGLLPRLLSFRGAAVGQEIKNPAVDGLVKDIRELIGLELFPKFGVVDSIISFLKNNGAVAILSDQRARKMNTEVNFFGRRAQATVAPAVLARKSGAAVLPAFIYYEGGGKYRMVIEKEIKIPSSRGPRGAVKEISQKISTVIEEKIREHPEAWLWGHRRWRRDN